MTKILLVTGVHESEAEFGRRTIDEFKKQVRYDSDLITLWHVLNNKGSSKRNLKEQKRAYQEVQVIMRIHEPKVLLDLHCGFLDPLYAEIAEIGDSFEFYCDIFSNYPERLHSLNIRGVKVLFDREQNPLVDKRELPDITGQTVLTLPEHLLLVGIEAYLGCCEYELQLDSLQVEHDISDQIYKTSMLLKYLYDLFLPI